MRLKALYIFLPGVFFHLAIMSSRAQKQEDRPNILWIVCEDTSPLLGCYGDTFATTPYLDRFATEAVVYENAFSTAPACSPARSTLITGMFASALGTENLRSGYPIPAFVKFFPRYLREAGYYTTNNAKEDYNTVNQPDAWDESSQNATYKNRAPGQPFFAVFNLGVTHESRIHKSAVALKHDPEKVPLPPYHPAIPEIKNDWALFYDNIEKMDAQAGKLLLELEEAGLSENTIVFFYSDNGGVIARSKRFINESGLRVPLIIRFPEKYKTMSPGEPGSRIDRVVSFEDFAPTVLSLAGVEVPGYMKGSVFLGARQSPEKAYAFAFRSRIDERTDLIRSIRDKRYRYVRNYMPHKVYGQHSEYLWQAPSVAAWEKSFEMGSLNEEQAAFWKQKPAEELYDVEVDPHNVNNLAGRKEYKVVLEKMRNDTREIILQTRDAGFIPEAMKVAISDTLSVYEFARSKHYPLESILETAEMSSLRDARYAKELSRRLSDENPLVRFWAATGCCILGKEAQWAQSQLAVLLKDKEPAVQVAAAEALFSMGDKNGLPVLIEILHSDNMHARLQALVALEGMGPDAAPALPEIIKMFEARQTRSMKKQPSWKYEHDVKIANQLIVKLGSGSKN